MGKIIRLSFSIMNIIGSRSFSFAEIYRRVSPITQAMHHDWVGPDTYIGLPKFIGHGLGGTLILQQFAGH